VMEPLSALASFQRSGPDSLKKLVKSTMTV